MSTNTTTLPQGMTHGQMREYLTWFTAKQEGSFTGRTTFAAIACELSRAFDPTDGGARLSDEAIHELREALHSSEIRYRHAKCVLNVLETLWSHNPHNIDDIEEFLAECNPRIVDLKGKDFIPSFLICFETKQFNTAWRGKIILYNEDETAYSICDCTRFVSTNMAELVAGAWHHFQYVPPNLPLLSGTNVIPNPKERN
jgi:hypothetical protein